MEEDYIKAKPKTNQFIVQEMIICYSKENRKTPLEKKKKKQHYCLITKGKIKEKRSLQRPIN